MTPAVLTLYYADGCEACAAAKPQFAQVEQRLRRRHHGARSLIVKRVAINDAQGTIDRPITAIPAFRLQLDSHDFFTDAAELAEKYGQETTTDGIETWMMLMLQRSGVR